nr:hypothetical protein [Klebsiella pneumoniae]
MAFWLSFAACAHARTYPAAARPRGCRTDSQGDLPGAAIHRDIGEQQRALALDIGTVDTQRQRLVARTGNLASAIAARRRRASAAGWVVGVHRIELLDTCQQRGFALAYQSPSVTRRDRYARRWGANLGITCVRAGSFDIGPPSACRPGALQSGHGVVEILPADGVDSPVVRNGEPSPELEQLRLGASQFTLRPRQGRLERRRVDWNSTSPAFTSALPRRCA